MNDKDIALTVAKAVEAVAAATVAVPTPSFRKPMLLVDVDPEVESAVDLLKEMYNEVVAAAILKSLACDAVSFIESSASLTTAIDFFVLCTFMASHSDSAASVPPFTPLPPQPTLTPTAVAASPPRILIDSFYAELNAKGYKFVEPEHPPEAESENPPKVADAPSKVGATINLKILINGKDLTTTIAEEATATPKALKTRPTKLKILMNGEDIALAMAEAATSATAAIPTTSFRKSMLLVDVIPEVESAVDLLKEIYNEVLVAAIFKSPEVCDAVAFIKSPVAPVAAIVFFVLCTFMGSSSDSAAFVPPSIRLPPQPTLAPTAVAFSPHRIIIDSFYAKLNTKGYKFAELEHPPKAEPEHPPKVAAAPSKAGATINIKIFINGKDLNTTIAEDVTATPNAPKSLKAALIKLKILMNGKDIALIMAEAIKAAAAATAAVPTPCFRKPMLPVNVDPEVEFATDLLKEMYNEVVASAILKSPVQLQISYDSFNKKRKNERN
ncbi:unnamed protein product [Prunus armeniaca]|uniref:Uncharacterized protein n=1 Tax=Prunus armeniaca TaxID=36596 RepID=A0A6J5TVR9_PRUAR|nr:unnamed protein product [Prunus armeniaca]